MFNNLDWITNDASPCAMESKEALFRVHHVDGGLALVDADVDAALGKVARVHQQHVGGALAQDPLA